MSDDITIPPEALKAAARSVAALMVERAASRTGWTVPDFVEAACLAMLRAWPKMHTGPAPTAEIARLRAENERLRAALEGYVCTCTGGECAEQAGYRDECGKPARAALEEKP